MHNLTPWEIYSCAEVKSCVQGVISEIVCVHCRTRATGSCVGELWFPLVVTVASANPEK